MRTYTSDCKKKGIRPSNSTRSVIGSGFIFGGICTIGFGAFLLLVNTGAAVMTMLAGAFIIGYYTLYFKKN